MSITVGEINNYDDFVNALLKVGMSTGGEKNSDGIFALCDYYGKCIQWHTEDIDTDPWEWRIRVLDERDDFAYGKFFFKKSGYITADWYPYFYAVRRGGKSFEEDYSDGNISFYAKRIYELICKEGVLPLHIIKKLGNFTKEDKTKFDNAITELQMKMYITMYGRSKKHSKTGQEYGWSSTVFCKTEDFFDGDILEKADSLVKEQAYEKLYTHILELNPGADSKKIEKFILGN
ncbi:AlkZ-related protein [Anaerocolumna sp.]|uniref:AlkZ-related protein n=1 Tax=Anaerocolumna sp. TaxID=2041569 RepID=UPI0028AB3245|nr:hypothetical protein [Anaerocolumna sp.]